MLLSHIALAASALLYLTLGVAALVRPSRLLDGFGVVAEGVDARNEVRAVYGGLPLAMGGLLAWSVSQASEVARGVVLALAVVTLGMALGRLASGLIDRQLGGFPLIFTGVEFVGAALIALGMVGL